MESNGSVTHWIDQLKGDDEAAAQQLWERYYGRLVRLCHRKLGDDPRRVADEEDVALSAFSSFVQGARKGRFPQLNDRDSLWRLLVVIAARKVVDQWHYDHRQKRGGGNVQGESALLGPASATGAGGIDQVVGCEPTPEFAATVAEECQLLLELLTQPTLRDIAVWKLQAYTNEEIADRLGCVARTIERKLRLIRKLWAEHELD